MLDRGVHVLPCAPFHWADPEGGLRFIRISLARPFETVEMAAHTLAQAYRELSAAVLARRPGDRLVVDFEIRECARPVPAERRAQMLAAPGFGRSSPTTW